MSSPRIRRLQLDYQRLQERFDAWPPIEVIEATGNPPENYRIRYAVKGLTVGATGEIHERNEHIVEINLTLGYPRRAPQCKILGPVFHPNFDANTICIGDFWAASEGLDDLIIRIGRMIAYQEYNTKSPLNGLAAKWGAEHAHLLPVDSRELAPPLERESETLAPISISKDQTESGTPVGIPVARIVEPDTTPAELTSNAQAPPVPREAQRQPAAPEQSESVKLGPELSLIHLKVRCEGCSFEFGIPLTAVQSPVVCPQCRKEHKLSNSFKGHVMGSAGLFWFTPE
jgi:ubiquitin-protein ligase